MGSETRNLDALVAAVRERIDDARFILGSRRMAAMITALDALATEVREQAERIAKLEALLADTISGAHPDRSSQPLIIPGG